MKKAVWLLLVVTLFVTSCGVPAENSNNPQMAPEDFLFYQDGLPVPENEELFTLRHIESSPYENSGYTMPTGIKIGDSIEDFGRAYPQVTVSCAVQGEEEDTQTSIRVKGEELKNQQIASITFYMMMSGDEAFESNKENYIRYQDQGIRQYRWVLIVQDGNIISINLFGIDYAPEDIQAAIEAFDKK